MEQRYSNTNECVERLYKVFKKHNNIIIAFDFDDTIFDYHKRGDTFNTVKNLLKRAHTLNLSLICFSRVYEKSDIQFKSKYLSYVEEIFLDTDENQINTGAIKFGTDDVELFSDYYNKPYYNIFLDDKSGLGQAIEILETVLTRIEKLKNINEF